MIAKYPTCSEPGEKSIPCRQCSARKDPVEVPMVDHVLYTWTIKKATCTEPGEKGMDCRGETTVRRVA